MTSEVKGNLMEYVYWKPSEKTFKESRSDQYFNYTEKPVRW